MELKPSNTKPHLDQMKLARGVPICYVELHKGASSSLKNWVKSPHRRRVCRYTRWKQRYMAGHFTFTFLRHPLSRVISFYQAMVRNTKDANPSRPELLANRRGHEVVEMGLDGALDVAGGYEEVLPSLVNEGEVDSVEYLICGHLYCYSHPVFRVRECDFVGRVESMEFDMERMCRMIGESPRLPHVNRSLRGEVEPIEVPDSIIDRVYEQYADDFAMGGYSKLPPRWEERRRA